jgi:hypothetical protein
MKMISPSCRVPALGLALALAFLPSLGTATAVEAQTAAVPDAPSERAATGRATDIRRAAGPIQVDGRFDDAGWVGATRVTAFIEMMPREGAQPPVETEVMMTYDDTNLYVAVIARDPNPSEIRATLQPRDRLWQDDWFGVLLDPYGDQSLGYYFLSNPIGVQGDLQLSPQREDSSIDFIYHTAGRITEDGYVIEMAIPFRSLRAPERPVHEWGIMLVRNYPRSSRHYLTWPSMSRNDPCQLCQLGRLDGLEGITTGGNLELLPAVVASRSGRLTDPADPTSFQSGAARGDASLGAKYSFRRGWVAEAT